MQEQDEAPSSQQRKNSRRRRSRTAVYVGCNKGIDAVNTLRMLSNDPSVDKFAWRDAFFRNRTVIPGRCRQELEPQYEIVVGDSDGQNSISNNGRVVDTIVHCLEAMPVTARHLADTAQRLGLYKRLRVQNAAVSNLDGWALFPDFPEKVGIESLGIDDCSEKKRVSRTCSNITVATLDSLLLRDKPSEQEEPLYVDFLSIDVEGHDFNVLLGAKRLLPNVRYLEFEYHWKEPWGTQRLSSAVDYLESFGFVCYWAGKGGHVWRITGCWWDLYNLHFWSNVACINGKDATVRSMAERLEEMFQATLKEGEKLAWGIDQEFRAFYPKVKSG